MNSSCLFSLFFLTIFFHEEEINENKKGEGNLAILYNEEAERELVILHKFCLPCVTHCVKRFLHW